MKTPITLLAICFSFTASASHHMGGYITAKQVSARLYRITTVLLTDPNQPANTFSDSISLQYGDGETQIIGRTSAATEDGIQRSTYITEHRYSSDGTFIISYTNPNLPANIVNVNGGFSANTPFYTSCMIRISSSMTSPNQSPDPLAFNFSNGVLNTTTHYNPTFTGGNNDELTFELMAESNMLPNYSQPWGSSINQYSGMITFTPLTPGLYLFPIRVTSYRNGIVTARTNAIQLYKILDGVAVTPAVNVPDAIMSLQGWYSRELIPNQTVDQQLQFTLQPVSPEFTAEVYSELKDKGAIVTSSEPTPSSILLNVNWTANPTYAKNTPYFITYRFRSSHLNITDDYNIAFYHGAPLNTWINDLNTSEQKVVVYPNPIDGGTCTIEFGENQTGEISVIDLLGKKIVTEAVAGKKHTLKTDDWKTGIYCYSFISTGGEKIQGKLEVK